MQIRCWYKLGIIGDDFSPIAVTTEGIAFADKKPLCEVKAQDQQSICNFSNRVFKKGGNF